MILLFLGLLFAGLAAYAGFADHGLRFIFAHIGGLGVIGLLACWAGAIAKKKGRGYWGVFYLGLIAPIMLGVSSVVVVHCLGGHGCGGIVSLFVALAVIIFYSLAKNSAVKTKAGGTVSSVGGKGL
jgi:hypothetical protein